VDRPRSVERARAADRRSRPAWTLPVPRLGHADLEAHLDGHPSDIREIVLALREVVLAAAPDAAEAVKFGCLSYHRVGAWLGSIGGNVCMIEVCRGEIWLSFIRGAGLPDPARLLVGEGKFKRFVAIPSPAAVRRRAVRDLIAASARGRKAQEQVKEKTPARTRGS